MPGSRAQARWGQRGRYLVPLGAEGPSGWFLHRLFAPHGGGEVLGLRVARCLPGRLGARLLLGPPGERAAPALRRLYRAATEISEPRWVAILDEPGSLRRRLVGFRFPPGASRPDLVVKLQPAPAPGLAREARGLARLRQRLPGPLAATLPEGIHHHAGDDEEVLVLSALPGTSGYVTARSSGLRRAARQLPAAARWLARFQAACRPEPERSTTLPSWRDLAPPADRASEPPAWYRDLQRLTAERPLSRVVGHGDFWPRNLLLPEDPDGLPAVVDWESWSDDASPLADLFHYPFALGQVVRWRPWGSVAPLEAFRRTFVDANPLSREVARYAHAVVSALGFPARAAAPLFRLYLLLGCRGEMPVPKAFERPAAGLDAYRLVERTPCVFSG